jgi:WS/DGAT/MGAT family acyltransferase
VSRLHGGLLDRHRPLWEFHLIEGVEGDRFAVYSKIHHAMMDGVRAMRHLEKALSTDPERRDMPPFWAVDPRPGRSSRPVGEEAPAPSGLLGSAREYVGGALRTAGTLVESVGQSLNVGPALASSLYRGLVEHELALPFEAPPSMLNVPITGARRFAAQSWPLKRIQRVRERTGTTINDVMLAMSAGALRHYLEAHDGLPEKPLVAALPVALEDSGSGNALGAILVNLATDEPDPAERLHRIRQSGLAAKGNLQGRDPMTIAALSAIVAAPIGLGLISNVPGPKVPLYWEGAKLDGIYPISVPLDGQALNITVMSYADSMEIGITGDRRAVPHLQHLLGYLEDALVELEAVADEADRSG